ncbi:GNAT family N-acetyltransferase [Actinomarinicola tropica]|uniref:GNAT family N-acetyltransferase n=2 Tax=Actinomarinicola tropica TaxID=2789776 RepID=A0A5Q2RRJ8_9ACTN|nr:GNAT family N-acetyltransferase [Actinomarinicola tropica]
MLVLAADWRPGAPARDVAAVLADPALAHYVEGWPRPDDVGVVAEDDDGTAVGAAWCRAFRADDPGYGFVGTDVPELAVAVVPGRRGARIGRALVTALLAAAASRGVERLSLSVEHDNPAARLYASLGFEVVGDADGAWTMVASTGPWLTPPVPPP